MRPASIPGLGQTETNPDYLHTTEQGVTRLHREYLVSSSGESQECYVVALANSVVSFREEREREMPTYARSSKPARGTQENTNR